MQRRVFRSRRMFLAAVLGSQVLIYTLAGFAAFSVVRDRLPHVASERDVDASQLAMRRLRAMANTLGEACRVVGSPEHDALEVMVDTLSRRPGQTAMVIDERTGRLLAHPDMREHPELAESPLETFASLGGEASDILRAGSVTRTVPTGLGRVMLVNAEPANDAGVRVIVTRHAETTAQMIAPITKWSLLFIAAVGLATLAATCIVASVLVRRYEAALEGENKNLGERLRAETSERLAVMQAMVMGLARLADYRDNDTGTHLERICLYSECLARALRAGGRRREIDEEWIGNLRFAASLHDIGKVGVPDEVLLKPGALTDEERSIMERHVTVGADTLIAIRTRLGDNPLIDMSIQVTLEHHERWDGLGYPYRLQGDEIALAARIVSLADVYDALTSKRVYKPAMPHEEARRIIEQARGTQFDPDVVDAFLKVEARFREIRDLDDADSGSTEGEALGRAA